MYFWFVNYQCRVILGYCRGGHFWVVFKFSNWNPTKTSKPTCHQSPLVLDRSSSTSPSFIHTLRNSYIFGHKISVMIALPPFPLQWCTQSHSWPLQRHLCLCFHSSAPSFYSPLPLQSLLTLQKPAHTIYLRTSLLFSIPSSPSSIFWGGLIFITFWKVTSQPSPICYSHLSHILHPFCIEYWFTWPHA